MMDISHSQIAVILLWLLFASTLDNSGTSSLKIHCNKKDQHTLLSFKQRLTDPHGMLSDWSSEHDCCQWVGIHCDNFTGRVIDLTLPCLTNSAIIVSAHEEDKSHCLSGELDLSLLALESLNYLDLSNHDFKAIYMPSALENSSNIQYLDLSSNFNLAMDNVQWLSHLQSLKYLRLSFIDLQKQTGWLQSLSMLPSLSKLSLESCQLESINLSLDYANFTSLQFVDLSDNKFHSVLPTWLFNLSVISYLDLAGNGLHGQMPNSLLTLGSLYFLRLDDNLLSGSIPNWLGQHENLKYLYLSHNFLSGSIPINLGNLSSMITLDVHSNRLNGSIPESLGQLSSLEVLEFDENSLLSGLVSERNFIKLSNLQTLALGSPFLIFKFDPHWVPPFQLHRLILQNVNPKLPPWIYTQRSLLSLFIFTSTLTHESQNKFWNFVADLEFLSLFDNTLNWDMSNVLLNSRTVWINCNKLRGGLPQLTPNVTVLCLANNSLSGSISPLLCHKMNRKPNLKSLEISRNFLSGGLTDCWTNWKSLVHVGLGRNNLTGNISHSIGSLSDLMSLHLAKNKLFGEIPLSLQNCKNLQVLNLADNMFSGNIPNWIGENAKALQLRSNQFSGKIPVEICQLSSLFVLDFANNRLSGSIPNCLNNITAMVFDNVPIFETISLTDIGFTFTLDIMLHPKGNELDYLELLCVLDLSNNKLSGRMPSEVSELTGLQSLNLSQNQLVGELIEEIGNMKNLESLDLSRNKLSGAIPQSMSTLSFLGFLNLSFNNFAGQIPLGTQLQSFSALSYTGNPGLCGPPLTKNCTTEEKYNNTKSIGEDTDESEFLACFYIGMGVGFAIGFWGVCSAIFFNRTWRHAYFRFLDHMKGQLQDMVVLKWNSNR